MPPVFHIDPHSGTPVYRQLMDQIKYCIASELLAPGDQLPSIRELAKTLQVNPTTIVKAFAELEHEGTITLRHGKGAFIAEAKAMSLRKREESLRTVLRKAAVEAKQLGFNPAEAARILREEMDTMHGDQA
jgi:GntR family transcriptional regulator